MDLLIPASILAVGLVVAALILRRILPAGGAGSQAEPMIAMLQSQVQSSVLQTAQQVDALRRSLAESMETLAGQVSRALTETHKSVGDRLDSTTRVLGDVRQQIGQLEASSRRMLDLGQDIAKLEQILKPPKLRGSLGELFLGDLLAQVLPPSHYRLQHAFKGGQTVDAVVILRSGMVPIDAKFPLENFRRIFAAGDEEQRKAARRSFVRDVKAHIDDIASKYIRTDEQTFDFALMYVPAENVYYETIVKDDEFNGEMSLFNYALRKRVIPVSPNSFYAYLQTIILGLKGLQVEERSREILDDLARLRKEFDLFSESFRLVGQHLDNSQKKFGEAQKRFGKLESKVEEIDGLARGIEVSQGVAAEARGALPDNAQP